MPILDRRQGRQDLVAQAASALRADLHAEHGPIDASATAGARRRRAAHRGFDLAELVLDSCARDRADLQLDFPFELDDQRHLRAERGAGGARGAVCAAETWALARRRGIEDALF